ncbi:Aste57867_18274 [Aphanomyces stellatus]|uniref:Aste57867_18274 protein n=1 Tax=Aphanomyces stellatus TaxID=120398 RepID=A0A485LAJ2_9STRA|nr:hypothetical protein As57867_018212 [Aphanomyces stellatus]VFT95011.1 Aste57867_18274 [Aphanomyces stellatus]
MATPCGGAAADDACMDRVLKRKVKNNRTNLFEWVKHRCHLADGFFRCDSATDARILPLQVMLANIISVQPKAASRFSITHATSTGHESDEFMAPTSQHCQRWVRQLQVAITKSLEIGPPPAGSAARHAASSASVPTSRRECAAPHTTFMPPRAFPAVAPAPDLASLKVDTSRHPDDTFFTSRQTADTARHPCLPFQQDESKLPLPPAQIPTAWHHNPAEDVAGMPISNPAASKTSSSGHASSTEDDGGGARKYSASEVEAEEQLGILVRVEGALKQLETDNKRSLERETALRHELANLQDSMQLLTLEKQGRYIPSTA